MHWVFEYNGKSWKLAVQTVYYPLSNFTHMVNLPIEYSDKPVTPFGGMSLMKRFVDQTGIRDFLSQLNLPQPGSNRGYDPWHIVESFWLGIWTGASRYIHCDWLRYDQVLQSIFEFTCMPSQSTYSRFFGKFSQARNTEVFPRLQHWFFEQLYVEPITVDFDSTVIPRYGSQQGAAQGYNPNATPTIRCWPLSDKPVWWPMHGCVRAIPPLRVTVWDLWKRPSLRPLRVRK